MFFYQKEHHSSSNCKQQKTQVGHEIFAFKYRTARAKGYFCTQFPHIGPSISPNRFTRSHKTKPHETVIITRGMTSLLSTLCMGGSSSCRELCLSCWPLTWLFPCQVNISLIRVVVSVGQTISQFKFASSARTTQITTSDSTTLSFRTKAVSYYK